MVICRRKGYVMTQNEKNNHVDGWDRVIKPVVPVESMCHKERCACS